MRLKLAYGREGLWVDLPDEAPVEVIEPEYVAGLEDETTAIQDALRTPVGAAALSDMVGARDTVAVVFSDITRPMPNDRVLPVLLDELAAGGVPDDQVVLSTPWARTGRRPTRSLCTMLGEAVVARYRIVQHDAWDDANLVGIGRNRSGRMVRVQPRLR